MSKIRRAGPLTFDPYPEMTHNERQIHVPSDKQEELMHWHYILGHLSFQKLKSIAEIGEIPKHLADVPPPVCAGCVFGAMTKVPEKEGCSGDSVQGNQAGTVRINGPNDIHAGWFLRPDERDIDKAAILRCHHIC